jgi:hypothetical protein
MYAKQFNDNTLRIYEDDLIISFNEEFSSNHNFEIRNYKNKIKDKNIKDHKYIEFDDYIILYSVNKIDTKHIALLKKLI